MASGKASVTANFKKPTGDHGDGSMKLVKRWGKKLAEAGWTAVPNVLLERQHALGLKSLDLNIIVQLMKHQWTEALPFPSKKSVASCIGVKPRTVQRRIAAMEQAGLIKRIARKRGDRGQQTNEYSLAGLFQRAEPHADRLLKEWAEKKKAREARYGKTQKIVSKQGGA